MFFIPAGTDVRVVKNGKDWSPNNVKMCKTKHDNVFDKEQVVVDPVGKLGTNRENGNTIGGAYAKAGWYGFESDGWTLLVHSSAVKYT